ncbi:MAG: acyltransferase [Actinobacteria bacterium]|nr:acyltransferase [Actinomycetota bacterium]
MEQLKPDYASLTARLKRRSLSVALLVVLSAVVTASAPAWIPLAICIDLLRRQRSLPLVRLLLFGWYWSVIECAGVAISFVLWVIGQSSNQRLHYRLMAWWAGKLMTGLRVAMRASIEVDDEHSFDTGNAVLLCRHASLADSLLSAWVVCTRRGLNPRYVLKRELLWDPCLDIVGLRVPNYFVDRGSHQSDRELESVRYLARDLVVNDVAVIFPEGTRSSPAKRKRAIERIREQSPNRLPHVENLQHLIPVRPSGTVALLEGAPNADVITAWHTGFDGLSTFGGVYRALGEGRVHIKFSARRIPRSSIDSIDVTWLDQIWAKMDREVAEELRMSQ